MQIDLSSLVDVRVVKTTSFNPSKEVSVWTGVGASSNTLPLSSGSSDKQTPTTPGTSFIIFLKGVIQMEEYITLFNS